MIKSLVIQLDKYFDPFLTGPARHMKTGVEIDNSIIVSCSCTHLASLAGDDPVVDPAGLVPAHLAGDDLDLR